MQQIVRVAERGLGTHDSNHENFDRSLELPSAEIDGQPLKSYLCR